MFLQICKKWSGLGIMFLAAFVLSGCGGLVPYGDELACPGTFKGKCQPIEDAYQDSVAGIDPRMYDEEWLEHKKEWNEKNKALIEARKKLSKSGMGGIGHEGEAPTYRKELFHELRQVIEEPETPMVIPPRVVRGLVLNVAEGEMFVPSHYVYFMLDKPKWVLKKVPELYVPVKPKAKYSHEKIEKAVHEMEAFKKKEKELKKQTEEVVNEESSEPDMWY